jgi:hypothetical protein
MMPFMSTVLKQLETECCKLISKKVITHGSVHSLACLGAFSVEWCDAVNIYQKSCYSMCDDEGN